MFIVQYVRNIIIKTHIALKIRLVPKMMKNLNNIKPDTITL